MSFATKLRAYENGIKNNNFFCAIGRFKFQEPEYVKEFRNEFSNKIADQAFKEFRYNSYSKLLKIQKTYGKLVTEVVRKRLEAKRVSMNKPHEYPGQKAKSKLKAKPDVEKTVKTAIETMRNALKKTKTAVQEQVEVSQETLVEILDDVVEDYKTYTITVEIIRKLFKTLNFKIKYNIRRLFEKQKYLTSTQKNEIFRAVNYNLYLAELAIKFKVETGENVEILIIANTLKKYLLQAVLEKVAEITAKVTADAEAEAVIHSLIDLIKLYSQPKAKNKYTLEDPWVAVRPLESIIDFVKREVLASIIHMFGTSCQIAYPLQHIIDENMREEARANYNYYIGAISYINGRIHILEELSKKHISDSITLDEIDLEEKYNSMKGFIPVFIAGIGNLQRLADEVEKQNKTITSAQLNSLRCCLVKILKTISALVSPGEVRNKTVEICDRMETIKGPIFSSVTIH